MANTPRDLGGLLHAASSRLATLGDRVLAPLKITSTQWKVLVVLARHGDLRVSAIVETLQHDQAAVSRLVTRMQRSGLVRRCDDPNDARAGVVQLTAQGRSTYRRCEARLRTVMGGLERSLSATEQVLLRSLLTRFVCAVDDSLKRRAAQTRSLWPVNARRSGPKPKATARRHR